MEIFNPANLSSGALHIPHITTTAWQTVGKLVGHKFSFRQWLRHVLRNPYTNKFGLNPDTGRFELGLYMGRQEVYADWTIPAGSQFHMLELAIVNTDWTAILMEDMNTGKYVKIRLQLWQPRFQYEEENNHE